MKIYILMILLFFLIAWNFTLIQDFDFKIVYIRLRFLNKFYILIKYSVFTLSFTKLKEIPRKGASLNKPKYIMSGKSLDTIRKKK